MTRIAPLHPDPHISNCEADAETTLAISMVRLDLILRHCLSHGAAFVAGIVVCALKATGKI